MPLTPEKHFRKTAALAASLKRPAVYRWLVTSGYFPESYVLPPCFTVLTHPAYGKVYTTHTKKNYKPPIHESIQVHFPKTELTDRTFGIIEPELHSDIALHIARNWKAVIRADELKALLDDLRGKGKLIPVACESGRPGRPSELFLTKN